MIGSDLNKLLKLEAKHALYREDGKWYHNLKEFPGVLFDRNGYLMYQNEEMYINDPDLQRKKDLHIKNGIANLRGYIHYSDFQRKIINGFPELEVNNPNEETSRIIREVNTILRKKSLVDKLKKLYDNQCQICGIRVKIKKNNYYSEVHHVIPLGHQHNGRDNLDNMICICPNHHVQLDFFSFKIDINSFYLLKHKISKKSISYHNNKFNKIKP